MGKYGTRKNIYAGLRIDLSFIAPKASAEGACILAEMGNYYGVWLVTVVVVCVVTVMLLMV